MAKNLERLISIVLACALLIPQMLTYQPDEALANENNQTTGKAERFYEEGLENAVSGQLKDKNEVLEQAKENGLLDPVETGITEDNQAYLEKVDAAKSKVVQLQSALPSKLDLRSKGIVGSVKEQYSGTCWAHAADAAAEVSLAGSAGKKNLTNLSVSQTAWYYYSQLPTDKSQLKGTEISQAGEGRGQSIGSSYGYSGNAIGAASQFMKGCGVAKESDFPSVKAALSGTSSSLMTFEKSKTSIARLSKSNYLGNVINIGRDSNKKQCYESTNEEVILNIKEQLNLNRGVDISYDSNSKYYNSKTYAQYGYDSYDYTSSHEACIVGYDDNYSKTNFLSGHQPSKNGAFICKNSWGSSWGDGGYFYLSYWDKTLNKCYSFEFDTTASTGFSNCSNINTNNEIIDQYDYNQITNMIDGVEQVSARNGSEGSSVWYSNLYTASSAQTLHHVGGYYSTPGATLTYKVYKLKSDAASPSQVNASCSTPVAQGTYTNAYSGFFTARLSSAVTLAKGEKYAVCFSEKIDNEHYAVPEGVNWLSTDDSKCIRNKNESFWSFSSGEYWSSLPASTSGDNWCVKAYSTVSHNTVDVNFNTNGGSAVPKMTIGKGWKLSNVDTPTKSGYTFGGWYVDSACTKKFDTNSSINSNTQLFAKWSKDVCTVSFESNGGSSVAPQKVERGKSANKPSNPTKTGCVFEGWYEDSSLTQKYDFTSKVTSNKTLYAKWTTNKLNVSFYTNGGTAIESQQVEYGNTAKNPPNPIKLGYTFKGWFTDFSCTQAYNFSTPVIENVTLYAGWTNDATPSSSSSNVVLYRVYNPYSGEHLFTKSNAECNSLESIGWKKEGEAWKSPTTSGTPVYRLYNPYTGDHHYTTDKSEYEKLGEIGWAQEGVAWYSDENKGSPVYRLYNPYVTVGTHHYTTNKSEYEKLGEIGWKKEGEGWYGLK